MRRLLIALGLCALLLPAAADARFRPRIGDALGLVPRSGTSVDISGVSVRVVYHGGSVMHGVTLHALFWAPPGYAFSGAPQAGSLGYVALLEQFLHDAAAASDRTDNVFSVIGEYPDRSGPGTYRMSVAAPVIDTAPYPDGGHSCTSAEDTATCVSDAALQREIAARAGSAVGLHQLWIAFLPPGVDECVSPGSCATSEYAGYHSLFETAHGPIVYDAIPDPTLEFVPPPGSDPEGNPAAESSIDTVAHEIVEAITDPEGAGWMDPNGFEVADRCETGPQIGAPLGYAPNGAPYNQVIGGHDYLVQAMWSNHELGCELDSTAGGSASLPELSLTQWSPTVSGVDPTARPGDGVAALLLRAGQTPVASAAATVGAGGRFTLHLRTRRGRPVGVGDDRDVLAVQLPNQALVIETGDGGNPFTASGWTGWYDLDTGYLVGSRSVQIAPCSQTGVLTLRVNRRAEGDPIDQCSTSTGVATVPTPTLSDASDVSFTSLDNRAPSPLDPAGGLVGLTVHLGEPGAVGVGRNDQVPFAESGAAVCAADLYWGRVSCTGLVPGEHYRLGALAARAGVHGSARFPAADARPGEALSLRNPAGRVLTTLHVSRLRVDLTGARSAVSSGSCEPGEFIGPGVSAPPTGPAIGQSGVSGEGRICPVSGRAAGLPVSELSQFDDRSGGSTRTEVPVLFGTAPANDAVLYGSFSALVQAGFPGARFAAHDPVSLRVTRIGAHRPVLVLANVDTPSGVSVAGLGPGTYRAVWTLRDRNGDTRTVHTVFVEAPY